MSFFPESLMPSGVKAEAEDVNGNQFVLSGSDHNRLDEEIRAIEKIVGVRGSDVPCTVVSMLRAIRGPVGEHPGQLCSGPASGVVACSGFSGTYPGSGFSSLMGFSGFSGTGGFSQPIDGMIRFPSDWPMTTLIDSIPDASTTDDAVLDPIDWLQITDIRNIPDSGYVTVINDVGEDARYATLTDPDQEVRSLALGTNVEVLSYNGTSGFSGFSGALLNVQRKQMGTTSTAHDSGDLLFGGVLSIKVGPTGFQCWNNLMGINCVLRSNGRIDMETVDVDGVPNQVAVYASYQATLVNPLRPIQGCP